MALCLAGIGLSLPIMCRLDFGGSEIRPEATGYGVVRCSCGPRDCCLQLIASLLLIGWHGPMNWCSRWCGCLRACLQAAQLTVRVLKAPASMLPRPQVFFAECALADAQDSIRGKRCLVSGSGCVGSRRGKGMRLPAFAQPWHAASLASAFLAAVQPTNVRPGPASCSARSNVATYCALALVESGAVVLAMSDSHGTVGGGGPASQGC